jgi:S-adenosylmethionine synthetase
MCSRIGQPLDRPQSVFLLAHLAKGAQPSDVEKAAREVVEDELAKLPAFCRALATGERQVP